MFQREVLCSITFSEYRAVYEIMRKNIVVPGGTHDNNVHAHCMLDT